MGILVFRDKLQKCTTIEETEKLVNMLSLQELSTPTKVYMDEKFGWIICVSCVISGAEFKRVFDDGEDFIRWEHNITFLEDNIAYYSASKYYWVIRMDALDMPDIIEDLNLSVKLRQSISEANSEISSKIVEFTKNNSNYLHLENKIETLNEEWEAHMDRLKSEYYGQITDLRKCKEHLVWSTRDNLEDLLGVYLFEEKLEVVENRLNSKKVN